jgi:hypothetical protein
MVVQIGAKPDSGFDDPIGMLKDCHRRIENFLDILSLVAERAHTRSLTGEERSAGQAALQYFHVGGERHTADEEESLFPRLRGESSSSDLEEIHRLESDHDLAADLHESVDRLYTAWSYWDSTDAAARFAMRSPVWSPAQKAGRILPQLASDDLSRLSSRQLRSLPGPHLHSISISRFLRIFPHGASEPPLDRIRSRKGNIRNC